MALPKLGSLSLDGLLRKRSEEQGAKVIFRFIKGGQETTVLTYADLDRMARAGAANIQARCVPGDRVVSALPSGPENITAFFACFYAGVTVVPVHPRWTARHRDGFRRLINDADPTIILTMAAQLPELKVCLKNGPLERVEAVETILDGDAQAWRKAGPGRMIQYTSGSTSFPRGVVITDANLMASQHIIQSGFGTSPDDIGVTWLPPDHDMGLIGTLLHPIYMGGSCIVLSPLDFGRRPVSWLNAISSYKATVSGAPNFAYDYCVDRIKEDDCVGLDLSTWRIAFCGSEPVRADTINRFSRKFSAVRFERSAFLPCYGQTEASLMISGTKTMKEPLLLSGENSDKQIVGNGAAVDTVDIRIVDPKARTELVEGETGEIWVGSPAVSPGYWHQPDASAEVFGASLADGDGSLFLRTGDLGFFSAGQLFVAGRIKELIIIRGRNLFPGDIEATVNSAYPNIRASAAFAETTDDGVECLSVACEAPSSLKQSWNDAAMAIRQVVAAQHRVEVKNLYLVRDRTLRRTANGKIRRQACRDDIDNRSLVVLKQLPNPKEGIRPEAQIASKGSFNPKITTEMSDWLRGKIAKRMEIDLASVVSETPISAYGLGSMQVLELIEAFETRYDLQLDLTELDGDANISVLVDLAVQGAVVPLSAQTQIANQPFVTSAVVLGIKSAGLIFLDGIWCNDIKPKSSSRPTIYFLNRSSWWDLFLPLLLSYAGAAKSPRFMLSHQIMYHRRWLHFLYRRVGAFPIFLHEPTRTISGLRNAAQMVEKLEADGLFMFPQPKLVSEHQKFVFGAGLGWLSERCHGADLVPVASHMSVSKTVRPQIFMRIGDVVPISADLGHQARTELLQDALQDNHRQLVDIAGDAPGFFRKLA